MKKKRKRLNLSGVPVFAPNSHKKSRGFVLRGNLGEGDCHGYFKKLTASHKLFVDYFFCNTLFLHFVDFDQSPSTLCPMYVS